MREKETETHSVKITDVGLGLASSVVAAIASMKLVFQKVVLSRLDKKYERLIESFWTRYTQGGAFKQEVDNAIKAQAKDVADNLSESSVKEVIFASARTALKPFSEGIEKARNSAWETVKIMNGKEMLAFTALTATIAIGSTLAISRFRHNTKTNTAPNEGYVQKVVSEKENRSELSYNR